MGAFDEVDATPRRTMVLFFIVDTSGSMKGERIESVNVAVQEVLPYVDDISSTNPDAQIKIAALEFSSGCEWMYPQPMDPGEFSWRALEAGGLTAMGDAFNELNAKLSKKAFMQEAVGSFAPAFIFMSDGEPTDDYKHGLEKLKGNPWFRAGIKVAIAIGGDAANQDVLAEFTGTSEAVLTVHNKEQLKKIIRFVSVTSSQVASKSSSVGSDAPQTKQEELSEKIAEQVKSDDQFDGVDVGTEVSSGTDDWGSWG
jgi:uncharacterized protein YegL